MTRTRAILVLLVLLTSAVPAVAQTTPSKTTAQEERRWNVVYPLVLWLPLFAIDATLPAASPCPGCGSAVPEGSGSSTGLSGAWFAGVRFEFADRFEVLANYNYAGLTASRETPYFKAEAQLTLATVMGGVRVYGPVFVEAGARYHGLDATFTIRTFPSVDWNPGEWSPAFGAGFRTALHHDWRVYGHIDWSGVGSSDLSTTNAEARVEWRPWSHFAVTGGYGFAHVGWDGQIAGEPMKTRTTLHGPIIGFGIPF